MTYYNFIGIYDGALTKEQCQIIIDEFEDNKDKQVIGRSGGGVKPHVKKSTDIGSVSYTHLTLPTIYSL